MGKRSKSCSSVKASKKVAKEHTYEISETESQMYEEPLQNESRSSKKNKRHTHSNEPVEHNLKLEENIEDEDTGPVELSPPVKKNRTNKKGKTCINKETDKRRFEKNIVPVETENIEVEHIEPAELSSYTKKVKIDKKTKTHVKQDDVKATVESETGNLATDLSKNKVTTKKKNKLLKESKIAGTDTKVRKIDNKAVKQKKVNDTQLPQEDEVKDEDIDTFCEEVSEEDNVCYNMWVELIEAKLSGNKKKPK